MPPPALLRPAAAAGAGHAARAVRDSGRRDEEDSRVPPRRSARPRAGPAPPRGRSWAPPSRPGGGSVALGPPPPLRGLRAGRYGGRARGPALPAEGGRRPPPRPVGSPHRREEKGLAAMPGAAWGGCLKPWHTSRFVMAAPRSSVTDGAVAQCLLGQRVCLRRLRNEDVPVPYQRCRRPRLTPSW